MQQIAIVLVRVNKNSFMLCQQVATWMSGKQRLEYSTISAVVVVGADKNSKKLYLRRIVQWDLQ